MGPFVKNLVDSQAGFRPDTVKRHYKNRYLSDRRGNLRKKVKLCMKGMSELKHSTTNINIIPSGSGTFTEISSLTQGTGSTQRVGNRVNVSHIEIVGVMSLPVAAAFDVVRMIVGIDKQSDGALPVIADVLESNNWAQPYNLDKNPSRFRILYDRIFDLTNPSATVTQCVKHFHIKKKLDMVTYYAGNAGTVADVLKNNIFVLCISSAGVGSAFMNVQYCYYDL